MIMIIIVPEGTKIIDDIQKPPRLKTLYNTVIKFPKTYKYTY